MFTKLRNRARRACTVHSALAYLSAFRQALSVSLSTALHCWLLLTHAHRHRHSAPLIFARARGTAMNAVRRVRLPTLRRFVDGHRCTDGAMNPARTSEAAFSSGPRSVSPYDEPEPTLRDVSTNQSDASVSRDHASRVCRCCGPARGHVTLARHWIGPGGSRSARRGPPENETTAWRGGPFTPLAL